MRPPNDSDEVSSLGRRRARHKKVCAGWSGIGTLLIVALLLLIATPARSQQQQKSKLPGIGRITSSGLNQQAFTGSVQSLDRQHHVLNVNAAQGNGAEIFPIQKKVRISSISGRKLKLAALSPGTNVVIYYQEKGGRRTVNQIVVLSPAAHPAKKKPPVSS